MIPNSEHTALDMAWKQMSSQDDTIWGIIKVVCSVREPSLTRLCSDSWAICLSRGTIMAYSRSPTHGSSAASHRVKSPTTSSLMKCSMDWRRHQSFTGPSTLKWTHVRWSMLRAKRKSLDSLPRSTRRTRSSSDPCSQSTSQTTITTANACPRTRPCLRILSESCRPRPTRTSSRNCNARVHSVISWIFSGRSSHLWSSWPL